MSWPYVQMAEDLGVEMVCTKCGYNHAYRTGGAPTIAYEVWSGMIEVSCDRCSAVYQQVVPLDKRD